MDKETLSNYGWIVICVLVLAVMIALAGPFGNFVADAVKSTTQGLFDVNQGVLNVAGISLENQSFQNNKTPVSICNVTWIYGKAISADNGRLYNIEGFATSDFIAITPNEKYVFQCDFTCYLSRGFRVVYYNQNEEMITSVKYTSSRNDSWVISVPSSDDIAFARIMIGRDGAVEADMVPIKTSVYKVSDLRAQGYNLSGKILLNYGDSIASGDPVTESRAYAYQIAKNNYMQVVNMSYGGSTIMMRENWDYDILSQVTKTDASIEPDYILLNGLTNDAYETYTSNPELLGTISTGFSETLNTYSFCGGFEATIKAIKEKFPNAKLIYVTAHINGSRKAEPQEILTNLAIEMCDKWDVEVADIYHESGLNSFDLQQKKTYIYDGSHPNTLGYSTFYVPIIEKIMINISK